jgi:mono/diheme cytochrome c family protein
MSNTAATKTFITLTYLLGSVTFALAAAGPAQKLVLEHYAAEAKASSASFSGFSPERGKALFLSQSTTGKPDTPSCSTCHTTNPRQSGRTRAGKEIDPMALSVKTDRYSDIAKTEKWFGRNCDSVLGRACTPLEKGDFITFMVNQ